MLKKLIGELLSEYGGIGWNAVKSDHLKKIACNKFDKFSADLKGSDKVRVNKIKRDIKLMNNDEIIFYLSKIFLEGE